MVMDAEKLALWLKEKIQALMRKRSKWVGSLGFLVVGAMFLASILTIYTQRYHCEAEASPYPWDPLDSPGAKINRTIDVSTLKLRNIIFAIQSSSKTWGRRKEVVKLWFKPDLMRGFLWMDENIPIDSDDGQFLPPLMVNSEDSYASGVRLSMILLRTFMLRTADAQWFVLCEDDTVFSTQNLMSVLAKYDPSELVYVGGKSESHLENHGHAHGMAFGGGGIAISYGLAEALSNMVEACLGRYPQVVRNENRLHACITELGVPLTHEPGFHQFDIRGDAFGLLAAHPLTPFVSMHHVDLVDPVFPNLNTLDSLRLFTAAMETEPASFLQQSICYDHTAKLSFSISLGYVVQVFPGIILPRKLQKPEITFRSWNWGDHVGEFSMNSRSSPQSICDRPFLFYLKENLYDKESNKVLSTYGRHLMLDKQKENQHCRSNSVFPKEIQQIQVVHKPFEQYWHLGPRRLCCKMRGVKNGVLNISLDQCRRGQTIYR